MLSITFNEFLLNVRVADALDVLILTVVLYVGWRWLQRRATRSVVLALLGLGGLYVLSRAFSMYLTIAVFQAGLTVMLFALVVIFQDDLRHAAERFSTWRPYRRSTVSLSEQYVDTLVEAVTLLAREHVGALIVFPGRQPLERHIRGGIRVDAVPSVELFHSIFHSGSRGHDGGVILRNGRIDRLGVHLPLSANLAVVGNRGTRHTAALGLAERTDALVVVVSEERGTMTLAKFDGLTEVAAPAELENHLLEFFEKQSARLSRPKPSRNRIRMVRAQIGSLAIALLLWFVFAFRIDTVQRTIDDVPVELRNLPQQWVVQETSPSRVRLTLVGPERAFDALDPGSLLAAVNLSGVSEGQTAMPIREEDLNLPDGVHLQEAEPSLLRFQLDRMISLTLPVKVDTEGQLPGGRRVVKTAATPSSLAVRVPSRHRDRFDHLTTEPIDLTTVRETTTVTTPVRFPHGVQISPEANRSVEVRIEVGRPPATPVPPEKSPPRTESTRSE